jgi:hypothetical protein
VFDLHVHSAPCVFPRKADDLTTVRWYEEAGFSGCVLKGHYEPTVGRAAGAAAAVGIDVYGGVVLNTTVGGLNPAAVEAALALGGRIVWMPTLDARASRRSGVPTWGETSAQPPLACPPLDWSTEGRVERIVGLVADAGAVLATGHLSAEEVAWLVPLARRAGVKRILLTHPAHTVPALTGAETRELVELGAVAEITAWQLLHQEACDATFLAGFVREVGYKGCVLSSDGGQPNTPPAPQALAALVDRLVAAGLDRKAVEAMASELPQRLVVP